MVGVGFSFTTHCHITIDLNGEPFRLTPHSRAPGLKFGFQGQDVAITFGEYTSQGVLVAYRVAGLDWQFTNITTNATHHFVSPSTPGLNETLPDQLPLTFEMRVTVCLVVFPPFILCIRAIVIQHHRPNNTSAHQP